jgi:uncharacterized protein YjbJ (UPF0337 family)
VSGFLFFEEFDSMNSPQLKGDWLKLKGKIKQKWGRFTDDDLQVIEGRMDELAGVLEKRYGLAREAAEKQMKDFYDSCGCSTC